MAQSDEFFSLRYLFLSRLDILFFKSHFIFFRSVSVYGMCVSWHMCGGQRTTFRSQFSPSTWDLRLELRLSSLKESIFSF